MNALHLGAVAIFLGLCFSAAAQGQSADDGALLDIVKRSELIMKAESRDGDRGAVVAAHAVASTAPPDLTSDRAKALGQIVSATHNLAATSLPSNDLSEGAVVRVFVTSSILEASLAQVRGDLFKFSREYPNVAAKAFVSLRGLRPGDRTIGDTMKALSPIVRSLRERDAEDPVPIPLEVNLDPVHFRDLNVGELAPVVIIEYPDGSRARAKGIVLPAVVHERHLGGTDDQGLLGPPVEIAERSLLDEIESRIGELDGPALQAKARERFWGRMATPEADLPATTIWRERKLSLAFQLQQDVRSSSGDVLVPAGQVFNPLEAMPFNRLMVVFNPERAGEIETVDRIIQLSGYARHQVRLIATHFSVAGGVQGGEEAQAQLEDHFKMRVFRLDGQLIERFNVSSTPTSIRADNQAHLMIVTEFPNVKAGAVPE